MTVNELIQALNKLEPDLPVIISGYEGGYSDVKHIEETLIILNVNTSWYYGEHASANYNKSDDGKSLAGKEKVNAIRIS